MKQLDRHEIYENLSGFLQTRGIELKEGSYSQAIQKSCSFLTDVINLGQKGLCKARTKVDKNLDRVRQTIHQATAPKPTSSTVPPKLRPQTTAASAAAGSARKAGKKVPATARKPKKPGKAR